MSRKHLCLGGCGRTVGTGCGCCSDDFPEQYGYCSQCFEKSQAYQDHMMPIQALLDRCGPAERGLLLQVIEDFDSDFLPYYRRVITEICDADESKPLASSMDRP